MTQHNKIKYIHWKITRRCNYNCSYCFVRNEEDIFFSSNLLNSVKVKLKGRWHIMFDGEGEPFRMKNFLNIVKKLVEMGHKIGVFTNLSSPVNMLLNFFNVVKGNLFEFNASLHLDYADPKEFFKKILVIKNRTNTEPKVFSVACEGRVEELKEIRRSFISKEIPFFILPRRVIHYNKNNGEKKIAYAKYRPKEIKILKSIQKDFFDFKERNFKDKLCWSGSKYLIMNPEGKIWRCQSAKRANSDKGYLGYITDNNFKLEEEPLSCEYKFCSNKTAVDYKMIIR